MTTFSRYYNSKRKLVEVSMVEMEVLIKDESKKELIAEFVYQRLYNRFLKIFDYKDDVVAHYQSGDKIKSKPIFNEEYKNGFIQLASCSLLVETFAAFLTGENETAHRKAKDRFDKVFEYANQKNNPLRKFEKSEFYKKIRCGILHQGETIGSYTVTRNSLGILVGNEINAFRFHKELKNLLIVYRDELSKIDWNEDKWKNCRTKIQHIISNTKQ